MPESDLQSPRLCLTEGLAQATRADTCPVVGIRAVVQASLDFIERMAVMSAARPFSDDSLRLNNSGPCVKFPEPRPQPASYPASLQTCERSSGRWRSRFVEDPGLAIETALGTLLRRGVDQGVFRASLDTCITSRAMMGAVAGVARWFDPVRHGSPERTSDGLVALYLRGLGAASNAGD